VSGAGWLVLAGLVGACVGSFLNVVAWRLPRGESLSRPPSRCPGCGTRIRWFDNVPVVSWVALRARCRACRAPISARYPLVEATTAALFVLVALRHGPGEAAVAASKALAVAALVAISAIDWDHRIIPDRITKPGIAVGLLLALLVPGLHDARFLPRAEPALSRLLESALGALAGWFAIFAIRWVASRILRREAMGLGDAKLLAFVGAFTSPIAVVYVLLLASLVGAVLGSVYVVVRSRSAARVAGTATPEGGEARAFARARVAPDRLEVGADLPEGARARVRMTLAADDVFEDEDVTVEARGVVEGGGRPGFSAVRLEAVPEAVADRLATFAAVRRYVPFGPFLALGGVAMLLYGDEVVRFVTETWPRFVRGE
jgi:leader peptidase (prepilin peptidase)/N-methyltransferase